jgi:hypothetical protein
MLNFDSAGMEYVAARAFQFCAWKPDSSLPEVARAMGLTTRTEHALLRRAMIAP